MRASGALRSISILPALLLSGLSDPANVGLEGQKGTSVLFPTSVSSPGIFNSKKMFGLFLSPPAH